MTVPSPVLLLAAPPVAASLVVLAIASVGTGVWLTHVVATCLSVVIALAGARLAVLTRASSLAAATMVLTLAGLAAPLLGDAPGPHRWAPLGPLRLYVAPVVLPSFLAACSVYLRGRDNAGLIACAAMLAVGALLAAHPDASQAVALLAGATVCIARYRPNAFQSAATIAALALIAAWSFTRPDPLEPVAHVEGVFGLAFGHSLIAGLAVVTSALALVAGLCMGSLRNAWWLSAVAAYYAMLFACSIAGMTPAPLIGYGAGPLLGFGLMAAVSARVG